MLDIEENPSIATYSDLPPEDRFAEDPLTTEEATIGPTADDAENPPAEDSVIRITLPLLPLDNYYTFAE